MNQRLLNQYFRPSWGFFLDGDDGSGGGGEGGGSGGGNSGGDEGGAGGEGATKTFSQEDVNAAAGAARKEGREAAAKSLADELGVPLDEAKALIKAAREKEDSEKSEAQKAREAADKERAEAEEAKAGAAKKEHELNIREALRDAGVAKERIAKVATLVEVELGADEAAIKTAVEATKKEFPELFGGTSGAPDSDTGGTGGSQGRGGKSPMEAGYERAKKDFGGDDGSGKHPLLQNT